MAEFFVMPQASPTMTVGVVATWVAAEGAELSPQSVIAQVETDKATMDIEVFDKGVMLKHLAKEGDEVPPGFPIAIIGKSKDEDISALVAEYEKMGKGAPAPAEAKPAEAAAPVEETKPPQAAPVKAPPPAPAAPPSVPGKVPRIEWAGKPVDPAIMEPLGPYVPAGKRIVASPLAKAVAADTGVNLARVTGSGPGGRIVAADVAAGATRGGVRRPDETVRATQMRKTIGRRLTEVHQQVPVFYLTATFDATALVKAKDAAAKRSIKISYNDLVLKAVAMALVEVPECNAAWHNDAIVRRGGVDVGVAVALPEGLITPVVRDADKKGVREIADEVRELAGRAKTGKLAVEEYTGSSFSISNLGMFDIEHFTAILNAPEAAILAVGGVQQVPVVEGGQLAVGWRMKVTMTCDHRVIDGALGARFLQALRGYIEAPALMVL